MTDSPPCIALFLQTLGGGGAERVLLNRSQGFVEAGLSADLVLRAREGLELWQIPPGVRVVNLDAPCVSASLSVLMSYLRRERPVAMIP
jgi:hypothetical protein